MSTRDQALVSSALQGIGLEFVDPADPKIMGGEQRVKVTKETLKTLKVGKTFIIDSQGNVTED